MESKILKSLGIDPAYIFLFLYHADHIDVSSLY